MLEASDVELRTVMEFDNIETIKRAVDQPCIALLPERQSNASTAGQLKKISIKDKELVRPLAIIRRKGRVVQPTLKQFIQLLTDGTLGALEDEADEDS